VGAVRGQVSLLFMMTPPIIETANLGMADSLILMVMALVVFGPRRLPQIGRQVGKLMYEFRKASNDFKFQMEEELRNAEEADRRRKEEERLRVMALTAASPAPAAFPAEAPAQAIDGQFPAADAVSPYPGEALYPVQPSADAPDQSEEGTLRIQPPTTGEQVPAAPPWNLEEELAKVSGTGADHEANADAGETPVEDRKDESIAATEPAEHHG
jgi:sec-independent protein translocase protein TatB